MRRCLLAIALGSLALLAMAGFRADRALAACTSFQPNELHFQSGKPLVRVRPYGHIARVAGRVTCEDGTAFPFGGYIGMAQYYALSTGQLIAAGGQIIGLQPDGTFSFTVPAGPSRRLYFAFAPPDT